MKMIAGLGNPGRKYEQTRHNVGFRVLAELAHRYAQGRPRVRFQGETVDASINGIRVLLLGPLDYMNNSGASVQRACDFFKLALENLLVVCDDFHLPLGHLRFRAKGSSGGQKGLGDVIRRLGTENISRLRIGIGPLPEGWDPADYVLGKFSKQERPMVGDAVQRAADAVGEWTREGIEHCMNRYN